MKFSKIIAMLTAGTLLLSACGDTKNANKPTDSNANNSNSVADGGLSALGLDENKKFIETRNITVEIYDRAKPEGSKADDNFFTKYIKEGMLRDHNVNVTFKAVPRWTEVQEINNLLAAGDAPDICITYDYPTVLTYANMGAVTDLEPYLTQNKEILPNLYDLLSETNLFWDQEPKTKNVWAIEAILKNNARTNTFVRKDWLEKLNIPTPKTTDEFEKMLQSFKDNASTLLGSDADKMTPYMLGVDIGYMAEQLLYSYMPSDITDKDFYVEKYNDRYEMRPTTKDAMKKLNDWYNKGLLWNDFALYKQGDPILDNYLKAGYAGSFSLNWDYPYRNGADSIEANLKRLVGEDATFVAIEPFVNDKGVPSKMLSNPIDRKVFFPSTNKEPVASLLYLDWISKLENRVFLQIGEEGTNHTVEEDGSVKILPVTGDKSMNSPSNIDYTITLNGLDLGDKEKTLASIALSYPEVDPAIVEDALKIALNEGYIPKKVTVGGIESEVSTGPALAEKRDVWYSNSLVAKPDKFDSVFDKGYEDYMNSGGNDIKKERLEKWQEYYGDDVNLPD